jgi:ribosomal protein L2
MAMIRGSHSLLQWATTTTAAAMRATRVFPASHSLLAQQTRTKTFRKKDTKKRQKHLETIRQLRKENKPLPSAPSNVLENRYWKVIGSMKVYKSLTPGMTNRRHPTKFHLHKKSCIKRLSYGKRSTGGRNASGRITIRHRGGGHKKRVRMVDMTRWLPGPHQVVRFEYDPNRSGELILLRNLSTNEFSYMLRCQGVEIGQIVYSFRSGIPVPAPGQQPIPKHQMIQPGNCLMIKDIPVGTQIHCIGLDPTGPAQLCRAAGTSAQLLSTARNGYAQIRLTSGEVRLVHVDCCATIGEVANEMHVHRMWGKAGARRRKGWRPTVRGIAMSPVDHPHGGGRKNIGNQPPKSPWGIQTKGWRTVRRKKWFVVSPRWANKKK